MTTTRFSDPAFLQTLTAERIRLFLNKFPGEVQARNIELPVPDADNTARLAALAENLSHSTIQDNLSRAISAIEALASPENRERLWDIVHRRLSCISLNRQSPLDCALEVWFAAPDEIQDLLHANQKPLPPPGQNPSSCLFELNQNSQTCPATALITNQNSPGASQFHIQFCLKLCPANGPQITALTCQPVLPEQPAPIHQSEAPEAAAASPAGAPNGQPQFIGPRVNGHALDDSSSEPQASPSSEIFRSLARLSPLEYDRARNETARSLKIRQETLDEEVAKYRVPEPDTAPGAALQWPVLGPWPDPIDGAILLSEVSGHLARYLVLPPGAADAITLWVAHTHAISAFNLTPRLNLYSPEKGCGKTTTLDVLATLAPRPLRTESLTAPVLFRLVDRYQPTLLLDEVDAYLNQAEELRGLLNAGNKRGACAYRCEGENNSVRSFNAFAPAALAGIGHLPGTLHDRSIAIPLIRARAGELTARFDSHHPQNSVLARQLARWSSDNFLALKNHEPVMPESAFNRLADNWRPLFAIAQVAGGDWPARALQSFSTLTAKNDLDAQGQGIALLSDIRDIFSQTGAPRLSSQALVRALRDLPDSPWNEAHRGNAPITEAWLGRNLRPFGITSRTIRTDHDRKKGYDLADFTETFARFLPALPIMACRDHAA